MTFVKRQVDPEGYTALERIAEAHQAMQAASDERAAQRAAQAGLRREAIGEARKHGVSLDSIAERLGVSRERIREIEAGK